MSLKQNETLTMIDSFIHNYVGSVIYNNKFIVITFVSLSSKYLQTFQCNSDIVGDNFEAKMTSGQMVVCSVTRWSVRHRAAKKV